MVAVDVWRGTVGDKRSRQWECVRVGGEECGKGAVYDVRVEE